MNQPAFPAANRLVAALTDTLNDDRHAADRCRRECHFWGVPAVRRPGERTVREQRMNLGHGGSTGRQRWRLWSPEVAYGISAAAPSELTRTCNTGLDWFEVRSLDDLRWSAHSVSAAIRHAPIT